MLSTVVLPAVELGSTGRKVSRIGLGGMWLSIAGRPDRGLAERVIRHAVELGVTFIDTADVYCLNEDDLNHNEELIAEVLGELGAGEDVLVATKGGLARPAGRWERDGRPEALREAALKSRDALGVDSIALYQLHAPDPAVPLGFSMEALASLKQEGVIEAVGLSNVDLEELQAAREVVEITSVQNRYNPWDRADEESGLLEYCDEEGITYIPYSPLGGARRVRLLVEHVAFWRLAAGHGATPAELVLGWLLSKSERLVPIPSARRPGSIESSVRAASMELDDVTLRALEAEFDKLPR